MPPFAGPCAATDGVAKKMAQSNVIALNVGGQVFQTSPQTLAQAGPSSLLSAFTTVSSTQSDPCFIDRDPDLFAVLLSLLRTGNLPSKAKSFDLQDLISEAEYYGLQSHLVSSLSNPSQFDAFNLEKSLVLPLNGRDSPSAISSTPYGSLHVAHGSKITSFDWALRRKSTILTQFSAVDSLLSISLSIAAAGATDFSGLQILDTRDGCVKETMFWENETKSSCTVQAIGSSPQYLFTSFESGRRNSNSIMVFDLSGSLRPVMEIARQEIYGADIDSAIPSTKLEWLSGFNLLMASGTHGGPFGLLGNVKLWDLRSGTAAWELKEKVDCFSDVTASNNLSSIFKVGVNSGEVFTADIRKLSVQNPWICLGEGRKVNGKKEGAGSKIQSHGSQIFCSKGGDVELWSEVMMGSSRSNEDDVGDRVFRKNSLGRAKDMGGCRITNLCFGGNKMILTRKDQQSVEVWQSPRV